MCITPECQDQEFYLNNWPVEHIDSFKLHEEAVGKLEKKTNEERLNAYGTIPCAIHYIGMSDSPQCRQGNVSSEMLKTAKIYKFSIQIPVC